MLKQYITAYLGNKEKFDKVIKQLETSYEQKYYKVDSENLKIEYQTKYPLDVGYVQVFLNGNLNVELLNVVDDSN